MSLRREPRRSPGVIQPHGVVIAARLDDFLVTHVSDNVRALLGAPPSEVLGRPLEEVLGERAVADLRDVIDPTTVSSNPVRVVVESVQLDAIAHVVDGLLVVDLEPPFPEFADQTAAMRAAFRRLTTARDIRELWDSTAAELARITGFDRVLVYHFCPDGDAEVVAEHSAPGVEPHLGRRYAASDIPVQARELSPTALSRLVASATSAPVAILADPRAAVPPMLDLGASQLRAVPAPHREVMRHSGQASTFSLSLVTGGRMVGMIACAHRTERRIPYATREALEILANQISLHLSGMVEIARLERRNRIREVRATLLTQVELTPRIPDAVLRGSVTLLDLVPADGAVIHLDGEFHRIGQVPAAADLVEFAGVLDASRGLTFSSSAIRLDHPELAATVPDFGAVLVRPFGRTGDYVAWFRHAVARTPAGLGENLPGWGGAELEVGELCRDLDSVLLRRVESELAELALRDSLTGLPNRRLLMDRLGQGLARAERQRGLAVLFIDLDGFKKINDGYGHAAGDDALQFVARRLDETARREDTVARLGGDEFVVLCENTTAGEAAGIAQRILAALAAPDDPAPPWSITASIGIAMAETDAGASQLLSAADAAMYRAKTAGANRVEFSFE